MLKELVNYAKWLKEDYLFNVELSFRENRKFILITNFFDGGRINEITK